jgi:amino acid transporter
VTRPVRQLTLIDCFGLGINGILGSGIFLLPAALQRRAGSHSPLAWLVVGSLCTLIALCFAEATSRTDRSGGPYVWNYRGVNTFGAGRMEELGSHPTVKPVALVADAMRDCTRRRDICLDTFSGLGTTITRSEALLGTLSTGATQRRCCFSPPRSTILLLAGLAMHRHQRPLWFRGNIASSVWGDFKRQNVGQASIQISRALRSLA